MGDQVTALMSRVCPFSPTPAELTSVWGTPNPPVHSIIHCLFPPWLFPVVSAPCPFWGLPFPFLDSEALFGLIGGERGGSLTFFPWLASGSAWSVSRLTLPPLTCFLPAQSSFGSSTRFFFFFLQSPSFENNTSPVASCRHPLGNRRGAPKHDSSHCVCLTHETSRGPLELRSVAKPFLQ